MHNNTLKTCDLLIKADHIITMNGSLSIFSPGIVAIKKNKIINVNQFRDKEKENWKPRKFLDLKDHILMPGLINVHTHAGMTLFKGIEDDLPLHEWLNEQIFPIEKKFVDAEFVYLSTMLAIVQMLYTGTTTFVDMYYYENEAARAVNENGIRALLGPGILDFPTPDAQSNKKALMNAEKFLNQYTEHPRISPIIAPHAPYTCSNKTLLTCKELAEAYDCLIHIHAQETKKELEDSIKQYSKSPVERLMELGLLRKKALLVHMVWLTKKDHELLADVMPGIAYCPQSNMKLGSGIADIVTLKNMGLAIGLGTDSAVSNNSLDLFMEAKVAALLQKLYHNEPSCIKAQEVIEFATSKAARAISMEDKIGSIEKGKKADLISIAYNTSKDMPMYDVYSHIAYACSGNMVKTVIVDGKIIIENGKFLNDPSIKLMEQWKKKARHIRSYLTKQKRP